MTAKTISPRTVSRVCPYLRTLEDLIKKKKTSVSSGELSRLTGLTAVQIRKDISHIGPAGKPRVGYGTRELRRLLEDFIIGEKTVRVVLFGVGNLGKAIMKYPGFHQDRIRLVAAFDKVKEKIGKKIAGIEVYPVGRAPEVIKREKADIGIIAVPAENSREVGRVIVAAGLKGIVNFAPVNIDVSHPVQVRDIDLSIEFLSLFCNIKHGK